MNYTEPHVPPADPNLSKREKKKLKNPVSGLSKKLTGVFKYEEQQVTLANLDNNTVLLCAS